jgi:hypothetical protein
LHGSRFSNGILRNFHSVLAVLLRYPTHFEDSTKSPFVLIYRVFSALPAPYFGATSAFVLHYGASITSPRELRGRVGMELKEAYLDRVLGEVEDLSSRVAELKGRFAKQKVSVKLEHYWELEYVRTRFTEFKRRVEDLEEAHDGELVRFQESVEIAWKDLIHAMETLLAALP